MFETLRRLLPGGRAWRLARNSTIRPFYEALATLGDDFKVYADLIWSSIDPKVTDELDAWEAELGLSSGAGLTDAERRSRLAGRWAAAGGQSASYLKRVLDAAGFNQLHVHEWWADMADPPTPRDPEQALTAGGGVQTSEFGDTSAQFGDPAVQFGASTQFGGYWLVNNAFDPVKYPLTLTVDAGAPSEFGDTSAQFGDPAVQFGGPGAGTTDAKPYYLYVGGAVWPTTATVPAARRQDLETLLLRSAPAHLWLVLLVEYT